MEKIIIDDRTFTPSGKIFEIIGNIMNRKNYYKHKNHRIYCDNSSDIIVYCIQNKHSIRFLITKEGEYGGGE